MKEYYLLGPELTLPRKGPTFQAQRSATAHALSLLARRVNTVLGSPPEAGCVGRDAHRAWLPTRRSGPYSGSGGASKKGAPGRDLEDTWWGTDI